MNRFSSQLNFWAKLAAVFDPFPMRNIIIAFAFVQSLQAQNLLRMEGHREPLERLEIASLLSWSVLSGKWVPGWELSAGSCGKNQWNGVLRLGHRSTTESVHSSSELLRANIRNLSLGFHIERALLEYGPWLLVGSMGAGMLWSLQDNVDHSGTVRRSKHSVFLTVDPRLGLCSRLNYWMTLKMWMSHPLAMAWGTPLSDPTQSAQILLGLGFRL